MHPFAPPAEQFVIRNQDSLHRAYESLLRYAHTHAPSPSTRQCDSITIWPPPSDAVLEATSGG
jgi:hypothetical protein